jgi:outer membrane protein assembly factor BamB
MRIFALILLLFCSRAASAGDWPQWQGPNRDGHAAPDARINAESLAEPKRLWRIPVGNGFSSPIISGHVVLFLDDSGGKETAHALDAATGRELWKLAYAPVFHDEWGAGPRATPFTDGKRVYVQSCDGEFRCLDFETGRVLWGFSFADYGVKFIGARSEGTATRRGNNGSGLLDGDNVIIPVGSPNGATVVCLDKADGTLLWKSGHDEAAYSSLRVADIAGRRQVVALMADALIGYDRAKGGMLWRVPLKTAAKRHAATPVIDGNRVIVNSHTFGTICFEITQADGKFRAIKKWQNAQEKINVATPVLVNGYLYSQGPSKNFVCIDAASGRQMWSQPGFGEQHSSATAIGDMILSVTDQGEAVLMKASPDGCTELARTQIAGKHWNTPALGNGMLVVRDRSWISCFSVGGKK